VLTLRVGYDGIVIAAARGAVHFDLTREQIYRAVAKSVAVNGHLVANPYRRWSDLAAGLPDRPILIFGPAPNHGTRDALTALAMVPACERVPEARALPANERQAACQAVREDGAWIDVPGDYGAVLAKLAADPRAVAVLPFSYLDRNRDRLQAASIDGIAPTLQSIGGWTYPLARPLFLYVKQAHVGVVPGLVEFVAEFLSDRAIGPDGYLVERGLAPLPKAWLHVERSRAATLAPLRQ
jgi:phosphate transport system substrate-binding protein